MTLKLQEHSQAEGEGMEKKIPHSNANQRRAGVAMFMSEKIEFKLKAITRERKVTI